MTTDRLLARLTRLFARFLTPAGTGVAVSVSNGATSHAVTFTRTEGNANYGVVITPSWATTTRVSSRSTTGFTANFGTAAGASDHFHYIVFRQES